MDVRLLYFDGCPNWRVAQARLLEALGSVDPPARLTYEEVTTQEDAERTGFRGSPTILVDGEDPFAAADDPVGLSCRLYRSDAGTEPAPTVEQLRVVFSDAR